MAIEILPVLINQVRNVDVNALISLSASIPFLAHIIFTYKKWPGSRYHVENERQIPEGVEKIGEVKSGELASKYLIRNEGENWIADIHDDEGSSFIGDLPIKAVVIPNSKNLENDQAIELGKKQKIFTVNKKNLV